MIRKYTQTDGTVIWLDLEKATAIEKDGENTFSVVFGSGGDEGFTTKHIICTEEEIDLATIPEKPSSAQDVIRQLLSFAGKPRWKPDSRAGIYMNENPSLPASLGYKARVYAEVRKVMKSDGSMNTEHKSVNLCVTDPDGTVVLSSEWPCPGPGTAEDVHRTWMNWEPTEEKDEDDDTEMFSIVPHDEGDVCL